MSRMPSEPLRPPPAKPAQTADQQLAMELALGALPRAERQAAMLRLRSDQAFRADVERWQALLSPLDDETAPELPPSNVWQGVLAEIAPTPTPQRAAPAARTGLWNNLSLWRGLGLAGPALAALALMVANPAAPPALVPASVTAPPALLSASLADATGKPLLAATFDPLRGTVVLTPATSRSDTGKVPELWVIEGDASPRSLGVIAINAPNAHAISSQRISGLQPGSVLAISIEPIGGSPTGLPTGPVVATGTLSAV
jgi:anti-sigma-K factor RskA